MHAYMCSFMCMERKLRVELEVVYALIPSSNASGADNMMSK